MGRYNFSVQKITELEERLNALERANNELRQENEKLKSSIPEKRRILSVDLKNFGKVTELCGYEICGDRLIETSDKHTVMNNFSVFYENILRVLTPTSHEAKSGKLYLRGRNFNALNSEEYKIFIETLEVCIDTISYAKQAMKNAREKGE